MIKICKEVHFARSDEGGILLDIDGDAFYSLDSVGADIWLLIEECADIDGIRNAMRQRYDSSDGEIRVAVETFVQKLCDLKLVEITQMSGE